MPRIFDNIDQSLLPALLDTLRVGYRADICVGYFNLRGWQPLGHAIQHWPGGDGQCCRLLIGMNRAPSEELRTALRRQQLIGDPAPRWDNQTVQREKMLMVQALREQLLFRMPTTTDQTALQQLAQQLTARQLQVKLHLAYPLHAKLYLVRRDDVNNPLTGFVGSSNLTFAGLSQQGELNLDVLEHDACHKLAAWFEARWNERACVDITAELITAIETSWASARVVPPFQVYIKMAWLLSADARAGLIEFQLPPRLTSELFEFQQAAVRIAARYLNQRGGVLLGDVVGLGKSLMATALIKLCEDDPRIWTLIICPKPLETMWQGYIERYELRARVLPLSMVTRDLIKQHYPLVLIDEAHNLRNKDSARWRALRDYISQHDSRVILLSATPLNKNYHDLAAQLGLFIGADTNVGLRPERLLAALGGEQAFMARHQCPVRSFAAFEHSDYTDDWRDLMRLYLVRRTRSFIMANYATRDADGRYYLRFADGRRAYFPQRQPHNVSVPLAADDPYTQLYAPAVVTTLNALHLPRYGLGKYVVQPRPATLTPEQDKIVTDLARAGSRLIGFCRTNLFKRLESAGNVFVQSLERHVLRNFSVLHALAHGLDIPIGTQDAAWLSELDTDPDSVRSEAAADEADDDAAADTAADDATDDAELDAAAVRTEANYRARAAQLDTRYRTQYHSRFRWLPSQLFTAQLASDLLADARALLAVLARCGAWQPAQDSKLTTLWELVTETHSNDKVLIFTQFADTAEYLAAQLQKRGLAQVAVTTGHHANATDCVRRFAPIANQYAVAAADEVRVLITTDVLSEGQNLQDCAVVVNYDLPWAIIRLIQRVGRVDRIGQRAAIIHCYSFMPAAGVEELLRLRQRVYERLRHNAEVVGSDEVFFDDETHRQQWHDLYTENSSALNDDTTDQDVDLASYAYEIWRTATAADPSLTAVIEQLPAMAATAKLHSPGTRAPAGALLALRTPHGHDVLAWVNAAGEVVSDAQLAILQAAACTADTPARAVSATHHALVAQGVTASVAAERSGAGVLSGVRRQVYERIKTYRHDQRHPQRHLLTQPSAETVAALERIMDMVHQFPLTASATTTLNRQLRTRIDDAALMAMLIQLQQEQRLCIVPTAAAHELTATLWCSLGLVE